MVQVYIPGNETFSKNGDATLFCYNCDLTANLGGTWVLTVTIPIDEEGRWKYLTEESVLKVSTWQDDKQLYRVARVEKTETTVQATAYPIFFDSANDAFLLDCRPTAKTGQQALDIMCAGTPYSGESNITSVATAYFVRRNLMDAINGSASPTFIERWGGEILYDNYKVIINDRVGGDYGVEARYGRNVQGVVYAVDTAEIVTRIVPIAYNGYMMSGNSPWVDSPNINAFAKVYTREVRYENIRMAQDAGNDEDVIICNTQAELNAALQAAAEADFAAGIDAPKVTIDIDMLAVQDMSSRYEDALRDAAGDAVHDTSDLEIITSWYRDYASLEVVRLGDTIRCRHSKLDITTTARVVSITWDCVRNKVTHIVLGDYKYDYIKTVNGAINRISNAVREDGSLIAEKVQGFLDGSMTQLRIQNNLADRVDTMAILFEDLDPNSAMYGALGIGTQGICISKTRTADGRDWDWTTGITANGMNASMGVFGILADKLGRNWINLDTGEISLGAESLIGGKTINQYMTESDEALVEYAAQNDARIDGIESRIDGQYDTYFEDYTPTLQNLPASDWTTQADKEAHEGDLFYNKSDGNSYRFFENNGTWEWTLITDTVAAQALALASQAQDTADGKRRVFTDTPVPPYDAGDIYFTGTEILVCVSPKASGGRYAASDFVRKDAYNTTAAFQSFVTQYTDTISALRQDVNDRIETWTGEDDPQSTWDSTEDHTGDIWYDGNKLSYWDGTQWQEMSAAPTAEVAESLSKKAQIFISQPVPPYHAGDLWFDSTDVGSADILTCIQDSGNSYQASDWRKCNKYIDEVALDDLRDDIDAVTDDLQTQIDGKVETFRQATDPATAWGALTEDVLLDTNGNEIIDSADSNITTPYERIKTLHEGDLWHRTTDNTEWRYHNGVWEPMDVPDSLWAEVNSKKQIFSTQPTPPYNLNDLWVQGETGDILVCKTARESGAFVASDWVLASRYTGRDEFEAWLTGDYAATIEALAQQADGKAETWHQAEDPSTGWDDPDLHYGDLWYNTTTQESFFWDGGQWQSQSIPKAVFDVIDGKAQVFATQPESQYYVNDIWFTGTDILVCIRDMDGSFKQSDWQKKDYYTDDSSLTAFLTGDYAETVRALHDQLDGKSETWYQTADPSIGWTGKESDLLKDTSANPILDTDGSEIDTDWLIDVYEHLGDIWVHPETREQKIFTAGGWEDVTFQIPQEFIDTVDGKAQIFISQPTPPYSVGDLWYTGTYVLVCVQDSGSVFADSDWQKKDFYTDDSSLQNFISTAFADLQNRALAKIETWTGDDPSGDWTDPAEHEGDLWYNSTGLHRWTGTEWTDVKSEPTEAIATVISNKANIYTGSTTPANPKEGDLWFKGTNEGIYTFVSGQWVEYNKYTDDTGLTEWIAGEYADDLEAIAGLIDGKIDTYRQAADPSTGWTDKTKHTGDIWQDTDDGKFYRYNGSTWDEMTATPPSGVMDVIDGKAQIFSAQPEPPYYTNDLWYTGTVVKVCIHDSGSTFAESDWAKKDYYTDDSALTAFLEGDFADTLKAIQAQIDGKIETWYQATDPSVKWTGKDADAPLLDTAGADLLDTAGNQITTDYLKEMAEHLGDIWHDTTNGTQWRWSGGGWEEITVPDALIDKVDGKAQVFVGANTPQGANERDLWFKGPEQGIFTFVNGTWQEYNKYTDDENLEAFVSATYEPTIADIQEQLDGKVELFFYPYVPALTNIPASDWSRDEKAVHVGDLFYDTTAGKEGSYRFEYDTLAKSYHWKRITDSNITKALSDASNAQDTADSKRRIFTAQPVPPYDVGDLWTQGSDGDIKVCKNARAAGNYSSSDWGFASRYTGNAEMQAWLTATYEPNLTSITSQLDSKIETWYQINDPSLQWEQAVRAEHAGDLWYRTTDGVYLRYTGSEWSEITATPPASVQQAIADKRRVYVGDTLPAAPYDVGDIWMYTGTDPEMRYCQTAATTKALATDWVSTPTEVKAQTILQALDGQIIAQVVAGNIVNAINLSAEGTKIDASKLTVNATNIDINGVISANGGFKVDLLGNMEATSGKFGLINIGADKIYTTGHDTATSAVAGFLLHSNGTFSLGNDTNYLRFTQDSKTSQWSLQIALDEAAKLVIGNSEAATKANLKNVADTAKSDSDEAAKTASNYLYYDDSTGLVVSQNGTASGGIIDPETEQTIKPYNVQIKGDGVYFRQALKVLSKINGSEFVIYRPNSNLVKKMKLDENGLNFYRNDGDTVVASYTDAGFNVAMGTIGTGETAFTIDSRSIHNGTLGEANSVFISTGSSTDASIGGSAAISGWALAMGSSFGVTRGGALYCNSATISGKLTASAGSQIGDWTITSGALTNGKISIGSSGIRITDESNNAIFSVSSSGTVNASDAHFTGGSTFGGTLSAAKGTFAGELTAATIRSATGSIAGWTLAEHKLSSGSIFLEPGGQKTPQGEDPGEPEVTICGRTARDWLMGAGSTFGVTTSGGLYAKSGQISGFTIEGNALSSKTGVYTAYMRSGSSASTRAFEAIEQQEDKDPVSHFYVTYGGKLYTDTADLGGINLAEGAIYSGNHKAYNSSNAGFLLDKDGILSVGDGTNYIRYYKDANNNWKLDIRASTFTFGGVVPLTKDSEEFTDVKEETDKISGIEEAIATANGNISTIQTDMMDMGAVTRSSATPPTSPYKKGDIWMCDGTNTRYKKGSYICNTSRTASGYSLGDDWTILPEADMAGNAVTTANNAATAAANATNKVFTNRDYPPLGPYIIGDIWHCGGSVSTYPKGTYVCITSNSKESGNFAHWKVVAENGMISAVEAKTNYITFDDAGLHISNSASGYATGQNLLLTSTDFKLRYGSQGNQVDRMVISSSGMMLNNSSGTTVMTLGTSDLTFNKIVTQKNGTQIAYEAASIGADGLSISSGKIGNITITGNSIYSGSHSAWESQAVGFLLKENGTIDIGSQYGYLRFNGTTGKVSLKARDIRLGDSKSDSQYIILGETTFGMRVGDLSIEKNGFYINASLKKTGTAIVGVSQNDSDFSDGKDNYKLYVSSGSSRRYKNHVRNMTFEDAKALLDITPVWFRYKDGYLAHGDEYENRDTPGFYAEDVEEHYDVGVFHNEDGTVENWEARHIIPAMLMLIKHQQQEIESLKKAMA